MLSGASAGWSVVSLASGNASLTVPSAVIVVTGANSATFSVSANATIASNQSATVTASFNGGSANTTVSLVAPVLVSSLACNPTTLGQNASSACTVTLSQPAPAGGANVALSNTNSTLNVPASVTVAASATTATFTATTATVASNQSATVTASFNGGSANTTVSLVAPVTVSSLACNPATLGQNASSTCTVTLSQAAPAGGANVTLSNTNSALNVPASVTVTAWATTATFAATTATIASNQSATVTASYNGNSANATVSLLAPVLVSSVVCSPSTLGPLSSSACTVTLTSPALPGGAAAALSTTNSLLTAPASVVIGAGSSSAGFTLQAASFTVNQSGSVTAAYNNSTQTAPISLAAPVLVSSLVCASSGLMSLGSSSCTVALSQPALNNTTVSLGSSSLLISVPATVVVPQGATTATFNAGIGAIISSLTATITATLGGSSQTAALNLWATPALSSVSCLTTKPVAGASTTCTVNMSQPSGNITVGVWGNAAGISVPASVTVPQGLSTASFTASVLPTATGWIVLTATYNGLSQSTLLTVQAAPAGRGNGTTQREISCAPKSITVGSHTTCRLDLNRPGSASAAEIELSSSSASLRLPKSVTARAGQTSLEFQVDAVEAGENIVISADDGSGAATETVQVVPDRSRLVRAPGHQFVKYGTEVNFIISAVDSSATLSVSGLPDGASFDPGTGEFRWTPAINQLGVYGVSFGALEPSGAKGSASVSIQVDSGEPVVRRVVNAASRSAEAACSTGAVAAIEGRWLITGSPVSDATGNSTELGGTKVWGNGALVPVLSASPTEIDILCPNATPGIDLVFVVQTDHGVADPISTTDRSAAPGIFSLDGSGEGQGLVVVQQTSKLAMIRNYRVDSAPVQTGDRVILYATGIDNLTNLTVHFGESQAAPVLVSPMSQHSGVFEIIVTIPRNALTSNTLTVWLSGDTALGTILTTNRIGIAGESLLR